MSERRAQRDRYYWSCLNEFVRSYMQSNGGQRPDRDTLRREFDLNARTWFTEKGKPLPLLEDILKQAKGVRLLEEQRSYMRKYREGKRNDSKEFSIRKRQSLSATNSDEGETVAGMLGMTEIDSEDGRVLRGMGSGLLPPCLNGYNPWQQLNPSQPTSVKSSKRHRGTGAGVQCLMMLADEVRLSNAGSSEADCNRLFQLQQLQQQQQPNGPSPLSTLNQVGPALMAVPPVRADPGGWQLMGYPQQQGCAPVVSQPLLGQHAFMGLEMQQRTDLRLLEQLHKQQQQAYTTQPTLPITHPMKEDNTSHSPLSNGDYPSNKNNSCSNDGSNVTANNGEKAAETRQEADSNSKGADTEDQGVELPPRPLALQVGLPMAQGAKKSSEGLSESTHIRLEACQLPHWGSGEPAADSNELQQQQQQQLMLGGSHGGVAGPFVGLSTLPHAHAATSSSAMLGPLLSMGASTAPEEGCAPAGFQQHHMLNSLLLAQQQTHAQALAYSSTTLPAALAAAPAGHLMQIVDYGGLAYLAPVQQQNSPVGLFSPAAHTAASSAMLLPLPCMGVHPSMFTLPYFSSTFQPMPYAAMQPQPQFPTRVPISTNAH